MRKEGMRCATDRESASAHSQQNEEEPCMSRFVLALLLVVSFAISPLLAGKFNRKISVGDAAPGFNHLEATDGKKYSLDDFKDKELVVLVITCNECPVAQTYEERVMAFAKKYKDRVAVVGLNVCGGEDEEL